MERTAGQGEAREPEVGLTEADALRARFAATAERLAELEESRRAELTERIRRFVQPAGNERALDAGTGTGALAFALAPHVREVVAVDVVPELLAEARKRAGDFPNVTFREGDATQLPPDLVGFDLVGSLRTFHHIRRPELVVAELRRATRPGGRILVADHVAPVDPLLALDIDQFERTRDPTHQRTLSDADFRYFFEANDLRLLRAEFETRATDLDAYLDLAGCQGDERAAAEALAPSEAAFPVTLGWYLLAR